MGAKQCSCCEASDNSESVTAGGAAATEPLLVESLRSCGSAESAQASVPLDDSSPRLQSSQSFWGGYEKLSKILARDKEDAHSLDWINGIIATCYPHFNEALQKEILPMMREMVSEKVNEIKGVQAITIETFEFGGETPPQVGPLDVVKRTVEPGTGEAIELQWHLSWDTDCDIKMQVTTAVKSFTMGLTKFKFSGEVTVLLCPIVNMLPCVAAVQIYMVSPPTLDFKLQGLVAGLPEGVATSLNGLIRGNVVKAFQSKLVLPNRIMVISPVISLLGGKLMLTAGTQVDDLTSVKHPRPELLAEIGAVEARALTAKDTGLLRRATSDPYAIIRLGSTESRTQTMQRTLKPKWAEKGYFDFLVFNARQQVQLEVYDDDALGADDLIGRLPQIEFGELAKRPKEDWYDIFETADSTGRVQTDGKAAATPNAETGQMRTGQVKIGYTLFAFSSNPQTVKYPPKEKITAGKSFLQVQVRCLRGLAPETAGGAKVNVSIEGKDNMSQPSKFQKSQDTKLCKATSQRLAEYMIIDQNESADTVAEVSGLSLDTINAIIKNKPSFTCRWFQAIDIIIKDAETAMIDLEVQLKGGGILKMHEPTISVASLMKKPKMTDERLLRLERDLVAGASRTTTMAMSSTMNKTLSALRGTQSADALAVEDVQSEVFDLDVRFTLHGLVLYGRQDAAPPPEPPGEGGK